MRIIHLANHCIFGNGNVHAAIDLACAQIKAGHEVWYASEGGNLEPILAENGVTHVHLQQDHKKPFQLAGSIMRLRQIVKDNKIDIIHAHMMTGALIGSAASKLTGTPLITTLHNAFDGHAIIMGLGDRVIAVSSAVAANMANRGISSHKIMTVLNGTIGAARRQSESGVSVPLARPSITTVCGLHDRKGVRYLLQAFDQVSMAHTDANLYIIGEGPEEGAYKEIAKSLTHGDRIHFLGQLRETKPYLRSTDIFTLASLQDPCPLVIPEAREMGCAIVATAVDGIPEMLAIGGAGVLVPPANAEALASAILSLLTDPNELANQRALSLGGIAHFDVSRVRVETEAVYMSALSRRKKRVQ